MAKCDSKGESHNETWESIYYITGYLLYSIRKGRLKQDSKRRPGKNQWTSRVALKEEVQGFGNRLE